MRKLRFADAVPDIINALSDNSHAVRLSAVNALIEMKVKEAAPKMLELLKSEEEKTPVRVRYAVALGEFSFTEAVDDLTAALKEKTEDIRWGAAMAFKKIKALKAVPALIEAITDKSQKVSAEAIRALYFQTGEKLSTDFLQKDTERREAQRKWRAWWQQQKR